MPPQTRVHEFESAIRSACEPIFEKPLGLLTDTLNHVIGAEGRVAEAQGRGGRRDGHKTVLVDAVRHLKAR